MILYLCHSFFFALFVCFSMGYPHHRMLFFQNCSSVNPLHRVESLRTGLLQNGCPTSHIFCQKPCSCMDSFPQAAAPARNMVQHELSAQPPSGITLHGVLQGLKVDIYPTVGLHGLQGNNLQHHSLFYELSGIFFLASGASLPPSHSLTLQPTGLFRIFSLLFFTICLQDFFFYSVLKVLSQRQDKGLVCSAVYGNSQCSAFSALVSTHRGYSWSSTTIKTLLLKWNENFTEL